MEIIGQVIDQYGLPIAAVIGLSLVSYRFYRSIEREADRKGQVLDRKDAENKELLDVVIKLQRDSIESSKELQDVVKANTDATKRMETLIQSINTVLISAGKKEK